MGTKNLKPRNPMVQSAPPKLIADCEYLGHGIFGGFFLTIIFSQTKDE